VTAWWGGGLEHGPVVEEAMRLGASQDADELAQAVGVIAALGPAVVVEIGCDRGGTLYAWTQVCPAVYGITTADNGYESGGSGLALETHGAVVHVGDSHDQGSLDWLLGQLACCENPTVAHQVDALVIDGDHHVAGVRQDLAMYGPLVRPGGVILLHDISYTPDPRAEVWKLWPELAERYQASEIHNPAGGYGWGVIHVQPGDKFAIKEGGQDG
jgi:Methyltransferase domain